MARYVATVTTPRSPEEAFDYLADFSTVEEWDPGVRRARAISEERRAKGAQFEVVARFLGRDVPLTYETVEIERPRRVMLRAENENLVSLDTISFRPLPQGGGTEVTYDADLSLKGPRRLAEPLMRLLFGRVGDRAKAGLAERLSG